MEYFSLPQHLRGGLGRKRGDPRRVLLPQLAVDRDERLDLGCPRLDLSRPREDGRDDAMEELVVDRDGALLELLAERHVVEFRGSHVPGGVASEELDRDAWILIVEQRKEGDPHVRIGYRN